VEGAGQSGLVPTMISPCFLLSRGMRARERGEDWLSHRIRHNVQRPGQIVCRNNGSVFPSSDNIYLTK
jgi:hypothetical protein